MVLSDIWNMLGIGQTGDARAIKRAYAQKLKGCRPDEDPDGFQALYGAYQQALRRAKKPDRRPRDTDRRSIGELETGTAGDGAALSPAYEMESDAVGSHAPNTYREANADPTADPLPQGQADVRAPGDREQQKSIEEFHRLLQQVECLLQDYHQRDRIDAWKFLSENVYILDPAFNWQLGFEVFRLVAGSLSILKNGRYIHRTINAKVLRYLNEIFSWPQREPEFRSLLGDPACGEVFEQLGSQQVRDEWSDITERLRGGKSVKRVAEVRPVDIRTYYYTDRITRLMALLLDFAWLYPLALGMDVLVEMTFGHLDWNAVETRAVGLDCLLYLMVAWLFESSRYQATPGKMAMGLKVTTKTFGRLGYWHGLWRVVVFAATMVAGYITIIINNWIGRRFLHDKFSYSSVIDYRRSRREGRRR